MFSKREYEYVMEIAKEGSFSKAAQKLYISQPALSGAIKKIEKQLLRSRKRITCSCENIDAGVRCLC
ncbi:LysR family transcriptional regulator [uncultured Clostridium sp.]|uniref:helix-turn-helix domain-containing protein n=1 Tax=uncultured Clostridium sp. TaxID=59620 RepID=UPI00338D88AB